MSRFRAKLENAPAKILRRLTLPWLRVMLRPLIEEAIQADSSDLGRAGQRLAAAESAAYVQAHLSHCPSFPNRYELLAYAAQGHISLSEGLVLEFGVWKGDSVNFLAKLMPDRTLYGFDSFEGLPEAWRDRLAKGAFRLEQLPRVRENVHLVKGLFQDTLADFVQTHPGPIAFLHLDCDLYASARFVLECVEPRLVAGSVIVLDEYFNYPGWKEGEYQAFQEFIARSGRKYVYLGYVRTAEQVAVKLE